MVMPTSMDDLNNSFISAGMDPHAHNISQIRVKQLKTSQNARIGGGKVAPISSV